MSESICKQVQALQAERDELLAALNGVRFAADELSVKAEALVTERDALLGALKFALDNGGFYPEAADFLSNIYDEVTGNVAAIKKAEAV